MTTPEFTGADLRAWRERVGLTQGGAGDLLEITGDTVGTWERRGRVPRWARVQLVRKADLLNLPSPVPERPNA